MTNTPSLGSALVRGTLWTLVMRWLIKLIGMASMIILARLLAPEDYGVMGMAMLIVGLVDVVLDTNASIALLRHPEASEAHAHSAWTMKAIQGLIMAAAVMIAAPLTAQFFHEPRVVSVMVVLSAGFIISGLGSVGPILARRNLDFALETKLAVAGKVIAFFVTIGAALWMRNYWALAVGIIAGHTSGLVLGYLLHPYRPKWSLEHVGELWGFSQWMLVSGVASYLGSKVDEFIAGRIGTSGDLGIYRVASEISTMVSTELGAPINRALLPVLGTLQNDLARMRMALMKSLAAANTFTLPAGVGLMAVADQAVPILLGQGWTSVSPLLKVFALVGAIRFIVGPYYTLFMTLGRSRLLSYMTWLEMIVLGVSAWPLAQTYGVIGLVMARVLSTSVAVVAWMAVGHRNGLLLSHLLQALWRPAVGAGLMAVALWLLPPTIAAIPIVDLLLRVGCGASVYIAWIVLSWRLVGKPDGIEARVLGYLYKFKS